MGHGSWIWTVQTKQGGNNLYGRAWGRKVQEYCGMKIVLDHSFNSLYKIWIVNENQMLQVFPYWSSSVQETIDSSDTIPIVPLLHYCCVDLFRHLLLFIAIVNIVVCSLLNFIFITLTSFPLPTSHVPFWVTGLGSHEIGSKLMLCVRRNGLVSCNRYTPETIIQPPW